jgi:sialate O-acetylesterase
MVWTALIVLILTGLNTQKNNNKEGIFMKLKLPKLISNGMVLQRSTKLKIWGWASPKEEVTVIFLGNSYSCFADSEGNWETLLPELEAGGPYLMEIKASESITIDNILIGDVWICSGQSNMALTMETVGIIYEDDITSCENSGIRQFVVPDRYDFKEAKEDLEAGSWQAGSPETILQFTAVGYFFAKALFERYQVPIGLIRNAVGGSPVEAWMSEDALKYFPENNEIVQQLRVDGYIDCVIKKEQTAINSWFEDLNENDKGLKDGEPVWADLSCDTSHWSTMRLPGKWGEEGLGSLKGAVWFRKEIEVPSSMAGKPAKLYLGTIVDNDTTYINGIFVGATNNQYPSRRYDIPAGVLKCGENVITLRVISNEGNGEFTKGKAYKLFTEDETINLEGEWQYNIGAEVYEELPPTTFFQYKPLGLFNGMLAPLLNYSIKGVIWYQGESNTGSPKGYKEKIEAMLQDWREKWQLGSFPFLYVQLVNFMETKEQPSESGWAELREEQRRCLEIPNTGMAVGIDVGEWNDLHPLNKKDLGYRLALQAQKLAYGDNNIVASGPIYNSMSLQGNKISLEFDSGGGGLVTKGGGKLRYFAVAAADKKFLWAKAVIEGEEVIVWSDEITSPSFVRYAWADNPEGANLYNVKGLPASPFEAAIR